MDRFCAWWNLTLQIIVLAFCNLRFCAWWDLTLQIIVLAFCNLRCWKGLKLRFYCCGGSVPKSWLTLCKPTDHSLPGSSVHEILQARIWSGFLFTSPEDLPRPGTEPRSPALTDGFFTTEIPRKPTFFFFNKDINLIYEGSTHDLIT